jgi:hypothetical protein
MNILFIGDIFGRPGRQAVKEWLPKIRAALPIDFVIANAENVAGGKGITEPVAAELFASGIDVLTGGNHTFAIRESWDLIEREERLLRPANLAPDTPGRGWGVFGAGGGLRVAVLNLMGRAFMAPVDCPFRAAHALAREALVQTPILIVDFHAEATSEKVAMGLWLDGRATAVVGTHTHVPTADARILPGGTAAISDVGMSGPIDSIIGVDASIVIEQLTRSLPVRHQVAKGPARICAVLISVDPSTGRATAIEQFIEPEWTRKRM